MTSLLTPLLWSFLPSTLTHLAIPYLNSILPGIFPAASRGSAIYAQNYKIAFTGVIATWLGYTFFFEDDLKGKGGGGDWYSLLGVSRDADDDMLKKAFRTLSRVHHPDRAGTNNDETFIRIRQAYEVLSDPVRRYAYDRFGPQIISWKAASVKEHMHIGLSHAVGFYVVSGGIMLFLYLLGRAKHGSYWRHTLFLLLLYYELHLILSPTPTPTPTTTPTSFFSISISNYLSPTRYFQLQPQYMTIALLHKIFTTPPIAITQLAGVWADPSPSTSSSDQLSMGNSIGGNEEDWKRVVMGLRAIEMESIQNFQGEVVPILSHTRTNDPKQVEKSIQNGIEDIIVSKTLSSHPHTRSTWLALSSIAISDDLYHKALLTPLPPSPPPSPRPHRRKLGREVGM